MPRQKRWIKCAECDEVVYTGATGGYDILCPHHAHERRLKHWRAYHKKVGYQRPKPILDEADSYRVVHDPDPVGGFPRGATFTKIEMVENLRQSIFTIGTVLMRDKTRKVVRQMDDRQILTEG